MAERRYDPLGDQWVIVSPQRVQRPWKGAEEAPATDAPPSWLADCHLCPRNDRVGGATNPDYTGIHVFENDFPALDDQPTISHSSGLLKTEPISGRCRVVCYDAAHDVTLAAMPENSIGRLIDAWTDEYVALSADHAWVQIFENRGQMMGSSSDHPHGQIWASSHVPTLPDTEDRMQRRYADVHRRPLLLDYLRDELADGSRVVVESAGWVALVPYWASWPFETLLLPSAPVGDLTEMNPTQREDLAIVMKRLLGAYDALFGISMPYSMGWHGRAPGQGDHWQLHAHFYPPLLRSARVRKFMVGYEMLAETQRDLTPELAAERLRSRLA